MRKPKFSNRPRVNALPVLPVFFKIEDERVLLAGGGDAAVWKAELLLAAGAKLRIITEHVSQDLQAIAANTSNRNPVEVFQRCWRDDDFTGVKMAIGEFENDEHAARFAAAARAHGAPVNIIDKPSFCDFQFGSIVNRAPAVVAISTNGAAPVLGQAIRRRIESLLPPAIADWTQAAKNIRPHLDALLPEASARKDFWRRFADAAFTTPAAEINSVMKMLLAQRRAKTGKVTLVGAGPGDAEYLTLKAVRALQSADIILFDDLVSDEVLDLARRESKRMMVGKRGGRASCKQDDINATMLGLARQGKHVVRLKSGDPMVFGRAGEEIERLEAAGIDVDIAPGITAALAAAARLKTSLTHRDCAQGVKFITAHSQKGELPDIDWRNAADPNVTLMVYMGARKAPEFAARLLAEGLAPQTPVIVAAAVSRPAEQIATLTLKDLLQADLDPENPILIGVGQVFRKAALRQRGISEPETLRKNAYF
ncbi:MAG: siroheme synthase CysG [Pseudomonadota bacterium]